MDRRKLIQHGLSSLTIALPSKWLKEQRLKKGSEIFIKASGRTLEITCDPQEELLKVSIDISGMDRISALHYVQSKYRFGFDEIEIIFKNQTMQQFPQYKEASTPALIHYIVSRLVGSEIVEQSHNRIVIKRIIRESGEDFLIVLRRIFLLTVTTARSFIEGIEKQDYVGLQNVKDQHDAINNLTNYCLRLLNKNGYPDMKKTCLYYHIIACLDKVVDIVKYVAADIIEEKTKLSSAALTSLKMVHESLEGYHKLFYEFSLARVTKLNENRWKVKTHILKNLKKMSPQEISNVTRYEGICEILLDITESRMGLE